VLGIGLPTTGSYPSSNGGAAKKPRKERQPNWSNEEILAFIEAKRILNDEESKSSDGRDLMTPDNGKWQRISADVMQARVSTNQRDAATCKSKWNLLIPEYKRIVDFFKRTGNNENTYWSLEAKVKKAEGLPKSFPEDQFQRL